MPHGSKCALCFVEKKRIFFTGRKSGVLILGLCPFVCWGDRSENTVTSFKGVGPGSDGEEIAPQAKENVATP